MHICAKWLRYFIPGPGDYNPVEVGLGSPQWIVIETIINGQLQTKILKIVVIEFPPILNINAVNEVAVSRAESIGDSC